MSVSVVYPSSFLFFPFFFFSLCGIPRSALLVLGCGYGNASFLMKILRGKYRAGYRFAVTVTLVS